jgi:hypothetical protein
MNTLECATAILAREVVRAKSCCPIQTRWPPKSTRAARETAGILPSKS